jgi:iron complex transport system ATP-binding protein
MTEILSTHNLSIGYAGGHPLVGEIDVTLQPGELVCLLGPNGAGKTTLIRTLAGMQPALRGRVLLGGQDVRALGPRALARHLSVVLTDKLEVGALTAYELVALGRYPYTDWMNRLKPRDHAAVETALRDVGVWSLADRQCSELSDGERQRVMIARALAQEPDLMILDEPTAFLDLPRRVEIMHLLRHLTRSTGRAILMSTHDLDLALRGADRVWLLPSGGPLQVGAPEDLVLSGAFSRAFHSDGVRFDLDTGTFAMAAQSARAIRVIGDGTTAIWTRRALERQGCAIRDDARDHVAVVSRRGHPLWVSEIDGIRREHDSVYELLSALSNDKSANGTGRHVETA